jgi:hypothetical protein
MDAGANSIVASSTEVVKSKKRQSRIQTSTSCYQRHAAHVHHLNGRFENPSPPPTTSRSTLTHLFLQDCLKSGCSRTLRKEWTKKRSTVLTTVPGFWLLRAAIAFAVAFELVFCWKWIRPRGKMKTSPAFRVVAKRVSAAGAKNPHR